MISASKFSHSLLSSLEEVKPGINKGPVFWPVPSLSFPGSAVQEMPAVQEMRSGHIRHCGHFWTPTRGSKDREKKSLAHESRLINLFSPGQALRSSGRPLFYRGDSVMGVEALSTAD